MSYSIKTPHAAVLVWNYQDRIGVPTSDGSNSFENSGVMKGKLLNVEGSGENGQVIPAIISTLSCVSIQTSKAKGRPDGQFNLVLAPFKNWVSTLTPGSWCCLLMSNEPIVEKDLKRANKNKVKMFGRIDTVRCETRVDDNGARQTLYYVSGTDWGDVFNSIVYVDNLIKGPQDKGNEQTDVAAIALRNILVGNGGAVQSFAVRYNLKSIMGIMGQNKAEELAQRTAKPEEIGRLAGALYEFILPSEIIQYFAFKNALGNKISGKSLNNFIDLMSGSLIDDNVYDDSHESEGFVDPFSLQGTHSMWQCLLENSNPALNEMFCDFRWDDKKDRDGNDGVMFALYNRIKPFSYKDFKPVAGKKEVKLKSYFQYVKTNKIDSNDIISVNAGTNWRDKINFIEIKPSFSEFSIVANWQKQKTQVFDAEAFKREGFRSMIIDTKQFPVSRTTSTAKTPLTTSNTVAIDAAAKAKATLKATNPFPTNEPASQPDPSDEVADAAADSAYINAGGTGYVAANTAVNAAKKAHSDYTESKSKATVAKYDRLAAQAEAESSNDKNAVAAAAAAEAANNATQGERLASESTFQSGGGKPGADAFNTNVAADVTVKASTVDKTAGEAADKAADEAYKKAKIEGQGGEYAAQAASNAAQEAYAKSIADNEAAAKVIADAKAKAEGKDDAEKGEEFPIDWDQLVNWAELMREWYFGTHRMLNGTIVIHGTTPYIGIGENIRFDAGLLNPTPNMNEATVNSHKNQFILAHIESVSHSFTVNDEGARSYRTTIQFVRGIVTRENGTLFGEGMLDQDAMKVSQHKDRNQLNNISTSDILSDPDPQKVRGT